MGKKIFYFRFDLDAWERGTAFMTAEEVGLYMRLLCVYYRNQGPIPADRMNELFGLVRADTRAARRKVVAILSEKFTLSTSTADHKRPVFVHAYADEKISKIKEIASARRNASGLKNVHKRPQNGSTIVAHKIEDRSSSKANAAFRAGTISEKSTVGGAFGRPVSDDSVPGEW